MKAERWFDFFADMATTAGAAAPLPEVQRGAMGAAAGLRAIGRFLSDGRSVEELVKLLQAQTVKPIADDIFADPAVAKAMRQKGGSDSTPPAGSG